MENRLRSRRGFTLIEVLCAFLILALSASLLFTGIGAAGSMNASVQTGRAELYGELAAAEGQESEDGAGGGTARFYMVNDEGAAVGAPFATREVRIFEEHDSALKSYQLNLGST